MRFVFQHVNYLTYNENFGPFIFVGDGSVRELEGFNLGTDSYRPDVSNYTFMDFKAGNMRTVDFDDANIEKTHHLSYILNYNFSPVLSLDVRSRLKTGTYIGGSGTLAGIRSVDAEAGYTHLDGTPFVGNIQSRNLLRFDSFDTSWMNNAELHYICGRHSMKVGFDYHFNHSGTVNSSAIFTHEVRKDPELLLLHGDRYYNFNTAGEYFDGFENKFALYLHDEWNICNGTSLSAFVRAESLSLHGDAANNIGEDLTNSRLPGFNLTKGKITPFDNNFLNGAFGLDFNTRIYGGLSFKAQGIFTRTHNTLFSYGGFYDPSTAPTDTKFVQTGFAYNNSWLKLVSQLVYIRQSNYHTRSSFQHALQHDVDNVQAGFIETVVLPLDYDIESIGWTTDAIISPSTAFQLHVLFTLRDPKYKNFIFAPTFSDGVKESYDFSGKNVTALHKMEITIDPSYTYRKWRFSLLARYLSKQYINKTNSLYFKGRIETFGRVNYMLNKHLSFSANIINLLNQKGASGQISSADLVEDSSAHNNYLMAGTFIRPFTIDFGVRWDF